MVKGLEVCFEVQFEVQDLVNFEGESWLGDMLDRGREYWMFPRHHDR